MAMPLLQGVQRVGVRCGAILSSPFATRGLSTEAEGATTHYRITLRRSAIGLPKHAGRVLKALGLRRRLQSVYHRHTPSVAGAILAVKELVHVENVRRLAEGEAGDEAADRNAIWVNAQGEVVDAGRRSRKAPRGFRVVGNLINEARDAELRRSGADAAHSA